MNLGLIQTKLFGAFSSNLANMLTIVNLIDFGDHSSKVKVMMGIIDKCWVRREATLCLVIFVLVPSYLVMGEAILGKGGK